ncbi:MAG: tRNA (adenosine(37)-N6)-threonylcarbamoyltransferase complex dimerization subunit type 1 TsaB, partial [Lachnospiraceae bacterium]|nr:tRNA (adenosine(37)-N6)-threonylcarbamoyltransferase complex dimerization subunit type 1 TsaB [Lachnospiraceae bacterium]
MKILTFESSGLVASVAVTDDGKPLGECSTNLKKTHSETLMPMAESLMKMLDLKPTDLDAIAVSSGPGSFTGLRIGVAAAKGMALALNIPAIAVPTLDGLAYNLFGTRGLICPIMDARRNQVYTSIYRFEGDELKKLCPNRATDIVELMDELSEFGEPVIWLGDGVPVYKEKIREHFKGEYAFAPLHLNYQRAAAAGVLAHKLYLEGKAISADDL